MSFATLAEPLPAAIALGLFLGKQAGVTLAVALAVAIGAARLPAGISWAQLHGAAILTGIGFTMSLFIGGLAFPGDAMLDQMRIGVLVGSLASILAATVWLRGCRPRAGLDAVAAVA